MLRGQHRGCRLFHHTASTSTCSHVNTLLPSFGRTPLPKPSWQHASFPRRSLSLSSTDPIKISEDRQSITLRLKDGKTVTQKFSPSPKANLEKLQAALAKLLATPELPEVTEPPNRKKKDIPDLSFGTPEWHLDPQGDAIHRHTAHMWTGECELVRKLIADVASSMNHHPHITQGRFGDGQDKYMTITCTTHSPRGLTIRDTRLAEKINDILEGTEALQSVTPGKWDDLDELEARIASRREGMIAINREKISQALESCNCQTAEATPTTSPRNASNAASKTL